MADVPVTYTVELSAVALRELLEIAAYLQEHAPDAVDGVRDGITAAIASLKNLPGRFRVLAHSRREKPVRMMVVWPDLVYYTVDDGQQLVRILRIRHGVRRQPRRF